MTILYALFALGVGGSLLYCVLMLRNTPSLQELDALLAPVLDLPEDPASHNERIIAAAAIAGRGTCWYPHLTPEVAAQLLEHPTIKCAWSRPLGEGINVCHQNHGIRPAVWRRDMSYPVCRSCYVESPFE